MAEHRLTDWLPTTKKEVELRGWDELDVILFSADAYVDHPSFGAAVIGRVLEAEGLRVAIVPQPDCGLKTHTVPTEGMTAVPNTPPLYTAAYCASSTPTHPSCSEV